MIELKCPNCSADIELDDSREIGFCRYCGTKILIESCKNKINGIASVENLLLRAEQFFSEKNYPKAREYFNKVLDIDINNTTAKLGLEKIDNIFMDKQKMPFVQKLREYDETQAKEKEQKTAEKQLASKIVDCILNDIAGKHQRGIRHLAGFYEEYDNDGYITGKNYGSRYRVGTLDSSVVLATIRRKLTEEGFSKFIVREEIIPNYKIEKKYNSFWGTTKEIKIPDGQVFSIYIEVDW